jgi:EmrB/QacA subfamily drug resistance transporter
VAKQVVRRSYRATYVVLALSVGGFALLQSLVIPVLPTVQAGLHTSQNTVTWVLTAYLLSAAIFTPIMGRLGDMYGKERLLVMTLVALTLGSLLAAIASSISVMIVARAIQGIGGGVLPLSFGLIRDEFPKEKVLGAIGVIAALAAAGSGVGIVLAGPIVNALNYHWLFWIPMIVMGLGTIAAHFVIPESDVRTPGNLSWPGVILLSVWLVALILAISEAPSWGWGSTRVIGLIVAGLVIALVWVVVEARSKHPLIDMNMMKIPAVWTTNLVALLLGVGMYAVFAFLPEFLQTPASAGYGFGLSITKSGLILLPASIFMFALGMMSGPLSRRYGSKSVLIVGLFVGIANFAILTFAHAAQWEILLAMVVEGVGFGLAFSSMSALVVVAVPPTQTGVASGMNANIRTIGGSIGAAVMSSIVTSGVRQGAVPHEAGYTHGFALLTVAAIAATIAAFFVPGRLGPPANTNESTFPHGELGMVAAGTLAGDESE